MRRLNLKLLGPPQVRLGGRNLSLEEEIPSAILYYLAAEAQRVNEQKLSGLIWPGNLEANQSKLDEALDSLARSLPDPSFLVRNLGEVSLNPARVRVDLKEYQDLLDQAGPLPPEGITTAILQDTFPLLLKAVRQWRSPRFLDGFDPPAQAARFQFWLNSTRRRLMRQYNFLLQSLSDFSFEQNDIESALHLAHLALAVDRLDQHSHYNILRCLVVYGQPDDVRQYFTYVEDLLRRELDIAPSPRLVDLYRRVRGNDDGVGRRKSRLPALYQAANLQPFIGRKQIIDHMQGVYSRSGSMLILGESGIGKSRLLYRFAEVATPAPRLLLFACQPAETNLPLQPFIEMFRQQIRPDEWLALDPAWAGELTLLLPELSAMRPDLPGPLPDFALGSNPSETHAQLLEAIRQVFLLLTRRQPLVLCFDDLHWADETTIATVSFLLDRAPFNQSATLLATARPGEHVQNFENWLARRQTHGDLETLILGGLNFQETFDLTIQVLGRPLDAPVIEQVLAETGGNPLFLIEMLHTIQAHPSQMDLKQSMQLPLSSGLLQLIQDRLKQINPASRSFLELASLVGTEFDVHLVGKVGEYDSIELRQLVEDLTRHRLIEPVPGRAGGVTYRFIHRKVQTALMQEINPLRTRMVHSRIAQILEQLDPAKRDEVAAVLAQHLEYAEDFNRAFDRWLAAANHALQLGAHGDAYRAYDRAEALLEKVSGETEPRIYRLYTSWSDAAAQIEDTSTVEKIGQNLLELGHQKDASLLIGSALNRLSDACQTTHRYQEGLIFVEQALAYLEDAGDPVELVEAFNRRGIFLNALFRREEALESFQDALAVGLGVTSTGIDRARGDAHYQIADSAIIDGWPNRALRHTRLAMKFYTQSNHGFGMVSAYSLEAFAQFLLGNLGVARQATELGIQLGKRIHAGHILGNLYVQRGMIEHAAGRRDEALHFGNLGMQSVENSNHPEITSAVYNLQGDLYFFMEEFVQAARAYRMSMAAGQGSYISIDLLYRQGVALYASGDRETGLKLLQQAQERSGFGLGSLMSLLGASTIASIDQDQDKSIEAALQVSYECRKRGIFSARIIAAIILGDIARVQGKLHRAERLLRGASSLAQRQGFFWLELHALLNLDRVHRLSHTENLDLRKRVRTLLSSNLDAPQNRSIQVSFDRFQQKILGEWESG